MEVKGQISQSVLCSCTLEAGPHHRSGADIILTSPPHIILHGRLEGAPVDPQHFDFEILTDIGSLTSQESLEYVHTSIRPHLHTYSRGASCEVSTRAASLSRALPLSMLSAAASKQVSRPGKRPLVWRA